MPSPPDVGNAAQRALDERLAFIGAKEISDAETTFYLAKTEADTTADEDLDYQTLAQRYQERVTKARDEALAGISSASMRLAFRQKTDLEIARGTAQAHDFAEIRRKDVEVAELNNNIQKARDLAVSTGQLEESAAYVQGQFEAAYARGNIDAQAAQAGISDFKLKTALGYVKTKSYAEQVRALQQPWATENIPEDVRMPLLREAKTRARVEAEQAEARYLRNESTRRVQEWVDYGLSGSAMYANALKIENPRLQQEVIAKAMVAMGQQESVRAANSNQWLRENIVPVLSGDVDISEVPEYVGAEVLTTVQKAKAARTAATAKVTSQIQAGVLELQLHDLYNRGGPEALFTVFQERPEIFGALPSIDAAQRWAKAATGDDDRVRRPALAETRTYLTERAKAAGLDEKREISQILVRMQHWYERQQEEDPKGLGPTSKATREWADRALSDNVYYKTMSSNRIIGTMSKTDLAEALGQKKDQDPVAFAAAIQQMGAQGKVRADGSMDPVELLYAINSIQEQTLNALPPPVPEQPTTLSTAAQPLLPLAAGVGDAVYPLMLRNPRAFRKAQEFFVTLMAQTADSGEPFPPITEAQFMEVFRTFEGIYPPLAGGG